jgi:hypothetical protein
LRPTYSGGKKLEQMVAEDPRMKKWLRQCTACGHIGMDSDAPDTFFGRANLEELGPSIRLDESGLCEVCAAADEGTRV